MKITILITGMLALTALPGCKTVEQVALDNAVAVCTEGGYGPGHIAHANCINHLKPFAERLEWDRRAEQFAIGAALIARGINPGPTPRITCVQDGPVTRCY